MTRVAAGLVAFLSGCYGKPLDPALDRCQVLCGDGESCPGDAVCGSDGFCHAAVAEPWCGQGPSLFSAAGGHTCLIDASNALWCWGLDTDGQIGQGDTAFSRPTPVRVDASAWLTVSAGNFHTCGVRQGGTLHCWGGDGSGQLGNGTDGSETLPRRVGTDDDWALVSAGGYHTCAIKRDRTLWCWGKNEGGQIGIGAMLPAADENDPRAVVTGGVQTWLAVAAGLYHTCGIKTDGTLWCWGWNQAGQVGNDTQVNQASPVLIHASTSFVEVDAGGDHACARRDDGTILCWGSTEWGQLGMGVWGYGNFVLTPMPLDGGEWTAVSTGDAHTCALDQDGQAWCWGRNSDGRLGDGTTGVQTAATAVANPGMLTWNAIAAGASHTCAVVDDGMSTVYCWGDNDYGQLGLGTAGQAQEPALLVPNIASVSAGLTHTCAVGTGGGLSCWGSNGRGELGLVGTTPRNEPERVGSSNAWTQVTAGAEHTCALQGMALSCWGKNDYGQVGDASIVDRDEPVAIAGTWLQVSAGIDRTCAVAMDRQLYCWGGGQTTPLEVPSAGDWLAVDMWNSICGVTGGAMGQGSLYCWMPGTSPGASLGSDTDWASLTVGADHLCSLKASGEAWCSGSDGYGQLGNGGGGDQAAPGQVAGGGLLAWEISAGAQHTCVVEQGAGAGNLSCWGRNDLGQAGVPGASQYDSPVQPLGAFLTWTAVDAGGDHTCAVSDDTNLYCWGKNSNGQLGNANGGRIVPTPALGRM